MDEEQGHEDAQEVVKEPEQAAPNSHEIAASKMGWRPQAEWEGDPEDWVEAREFVGRQKLYDRISDANKRVKQVEKTLQEFKQHHEKVAQNEYERALSTLKLDRIKALEEGDSETLLKVEDRIDEVKDKIREAKQAPTQPQVDPAFERTMQEWTGKNQWYQNDPMLRKEADILGYAYVQLNGPGDSPEQVLKYIEQKIRALHPEAFSNENRSKPNMVEANDGAGRKPANRQSDIQLSEDEERAMKRFVKMKAMTELQYKAEIKKLREQSQ